MKSEENWRSRENFWNWKMYVARTKLTLDTFHDHAGETLYLTLSLVDRFFQLFSNLTKMVYSHLLYTSKLVLSF